MAGDVLCDEATVSSSSIDFCSHPFWTFIIAYERRVFKSADSCPILLGFEDVLVFLECSLLKRTELLELLVLVGSFTAPLAVRFVPYDIVGVSTAMGLVVDAF